ncbi:hypothetical protein F4604DRAFT_1706515 [Suillus subluteus]|nr:hypothetical protein F4604DRAFT_1706515 [Suillus subluteus]
MVHFRDSGSLTLVSSTHHKSLVILVVMSDANLAVTYSLIYVFLKQQSQTKAADAVKKAARNIIVLKDDLQLEGLPLDEIVKQWKESRANDSSSDSDSSDDSSDGALS